MKKLYFLLVTLAVTSLSFGQVQLNEFEPNPNGTDPAMVSFELKGTSMAAFDLWILSIESDNTSALVDRAANVTGTFDANGLAVVMVPDLENPAFTVVLCDNFTGMVGDDLDGDDDGTLETTTLGNVLDAIGIPDQETGDTLYGAQLGGTNFDYTGDEPRLVFRDGMTGNWFAVNDANGDATDEVYDLGGNLVANGDFDVNPAAGDTYGSTNPIYTMPTEPTLILVGGSPSGSTVSISPEDLSGDLEFATTNFVVGEPGTPSQGQGYIVWTVDIEGGGVHDSGVIYDTSLVYPIMDLTACTNYTLTAELVDNAGASLMPAVTYVLNVEVGCYNTVSSMTELRAGTIDDYYILDFEAIITYIVTENSRNQKYIQDSGAGVLIDDTDGTLALSVSIGDGLTGLRGQLSEFNGVLQLVPTADLGGTSSSGNSTTPIEVSALELTNNGETYESRLIELTNVTFSDMGTFSDNTNYTVMSGMDQATVRVAYGDEDLIGSPIPTVASDVTGLGAEFNGDYQIQPRYISDINDPLSIGEFEQNAFSIYPNPTDSGFVTITSTNSEALTVAVYDILGKQVKNQTITNERLDVSNLVAGIYLVKLTQNGNSVTKKLVIR